MPSLYTSKQRIPLASQHPPALDIAQPLADQELVDLQLFSYFVIFLNLFILFIYFWLHCVFVAAHGLSLVAVSGGHSLLLRVGFSLQWLLLLRSMGSRRAGFSSCGSRAQQSWLAGFRAQAQ